MAQAVLWFTGTSVLAPMIAKGESVPPLMIFLVFVVLFDIAMSVFVNRCTNMANVMVGAALGAMVGILWHGIAASNPEMLSFFPLFQSNRAMCMRPENSNFKCEVYKNGHVVDSQTVG